MQIGILEPKDFSQRALKKLSILGCVTLFSGKDIDSFLSDKDVLFIRLEHSISKNFLNKLKRIRYICTPTTGLNHIDLFECNKRGIEVISLKGEVDFLSNIRATPEHTVGLVLALLRNYSQAINIKSTQQYNRELYKGYELFHNSIGIIGYGRVGKIIARYFNSFEATVRFFDVDSNAKSDHRVIRVNSLEELIKSSKIIILSASYSLQSEGFIDKYFIDMMKDCYFVNIARGELVDEDHLFKRVNQGMFKGVAIDVIVDETRQDNFIRWMKIDKKNNFIITPHIGGATYDSMKETERFIVKKLISLIKI